jgi:hypothetical protein
MDFNTIHLKEDLEKFVNEMIGDGKECEKNLFSALYLFLRYFTDAGLDLEHMLHLILQTKVPKGQRNPVSDVDRLFEKVESLDAHSACLIYYKAYKLYPEGVQNQAAGNLAYKICNCFENWPNISQVQPITEFEIEYNNKINKECEEDTEDNKFFF